MFIENAKKFLEKYVIKQDVTFRGVFVTEFDREELLKILDMSCNLLKSKEKTINCLSRL